MDQVNDAVGYGTLLIAGPTASGKSALALRLAQRLNGCVINADSMQVYADLRIVTARPTAEDERSAPHRLFGFVDAARNYSVGLWLQDVGRALAETRAQGRVAILAGGTGLYCKALVRGLSNIPIVAEEVRAETRRQAEGVGTETLHAQLRASDPLTAARLRPTDRQRILRALEVFLATGEPLAGFQATAGAPLLAPGSWLGVFLSPDRAELRARIDTRFDAMVSGGALDEAQALAARGLDSDLPAMRAHGVPGLIAYLRGETDLAAAIARGKQDTRRYVKRQFTFARHQLADFRPIEPEKAEDWISRAFGG